MGKYDMIMMGPDRIISLLGPHSLKIPPLEIDPVYVLLLYSTVPAELRLFLCAMNRDSILTKPERVSVGSDLTRFSNDSGMRHPHTPLICAPVCSRV